jgi:putative DNA-invertase from lambdoid prophage Rac
MSARRAEWLLIGVTPPRAPRPGQRPKSDRLAPKVLAPEGKGHSNRLIGRELGVSKNTVADIVKHARVATGQPCGAD